MVPLDGLLPPIFSQPVTRESLSLARTHRSAFVFAARPPHTVSAIGRSLIALQISDPQSLGRAIKASRWMRRAERRSKTLID
ncbi:hypothetical protein TrVFT333_011578 [Trichoderma virens FT-333]|nr:hypothetical protein TrVFT333_011578 [Trichoderma virens FT-333]